MSKLNQGELLERLEEWRHRRKWTEEWKKEDEQAHQQIKEMIQKPGVTKEWIEEKAERFLLNFPGTYIYQYQSQLKIVKNFIRLLVEEIK